ncbi:TMEM192 [Bugula neritina]|uniref:Transmembrane protein 192 n=1 Tax=Bugula neritina TaxID=10212 RepID=A0A7J7KNA9_BUGNE|nr:TMEM192 [Bugula neritina]
MNMNVGQATIDINHMESGSDDNSEEDPLQDVLANTSLHITDSRYHENPRIAIFGTFLATVEIIIMLGLVATAFVLDHEVEDNSKKSFLSIGVYSLLVYSHSVAWFIVLIFDFLFSLHHRKLKMKGYLKFYRSVKYLQRHPFCTKSLFQTVMLALTNHLLGTCENPNDSSCTLISLTPNMWIQMLSSLETAVMLIGLVIYLFRVFHQNKHRLAPDDASDQMLTSFQPHHLDTSQGVGYRADNPIDDIIEHQADKIRSLQEQNSVLNRKLYSLTYKSSANAAQR